MLLREVLRETKSFFLYYSAVTLLFSALMLRVLNPPQWQSYALSVGLVTAVLLTLTLAVYLFFLKKNIALLTAVIVFKWPLLGYLVYLVIGDSKIDSLGFPLGIAPLILGALIWALRYKE